MVPALSPGGLPPIMSYPPDDHMLRALAIESDFDAEGNCTAIAPIHAGVCTDQGGMRAGLLATLVDVAGAATALAEIAPDRIATISLSLQSRRAARHGPALAVPQVLRRGSRQVVVAVTLHDGQGSEQVSEETAIAHALLGFRRLSQTGQHAPLPDGTLRSTRTQMAHPAATLRVPFLEYARVRLLDADAGVAEIDNHDFVRNSFGSLNGGMVACLVEFAGEQAGRAAIGPEAVVTDLEIHYVGQSGPGPIRSTATRLRADADHCVSRVELRDVGADDKLLTVATVHTGRLA